MHRILGQPLRTYKITRVASQLKKYIYFYILIFQIHHDKEIQPVIPPMEMLLIESRESLLE